MKKFFYFSDSSLKFIEIRNFKKKLISAICISSVLLTSLIIGGYFLFIEFTNSGKNLISLERQNEQLKKKLIEMADNYNSLRIGIDSLAFHGENLRLAINLKPITPDERLLGVGGGVNNYFDDLRLENFNITAAIDLVDEMNRRFEFEKSQYLEITGKLKENNELFECIPAIKPTDGIYTTYDFGMRLHPILKVRKFHGGIDINNNYGTPVYAPGKGKVIYSGRRAGYGRVIEINHGFGYSTIYAHLSKSLVKRGQIVQRGDLIAKSGNSGLSSGPHLHYEVHHNGKKLNPVDFFFEDINFFELNSEN